MPALYRKQLHFNFIGLFMIILMGSTYLIDRVVIFLMRPQLLELYRTYFSGSKKNINAQQIAWLALFTQVYYLVVFICVALLLWLILSVFKHCRVFLREFGYAIISILAIKMVVVCIIKYVLKIQ